MTVNEWKAEQGGETAVVIRAHEAGAFDDLFARWWNRRETSGCALDRYEFEDACAERVADLVDVTRDQAAAIVHNIHSGFWLGSERGK